MLSAIKNTEYTPQQAWGRNSNERRRNYLEAGQVIFMLLFMSGCLYQCSVFLEIYMKHPTTVEVTTQNSPFLKFPAVTFCSSNRVRKSAWCKLQKEVCQENADKLWFRKHLQELYDKVNYTARIALGVQRDTILISCSYGSLNCRNITSQFYDYEYTNCFTFNAKWGHSNIGDHDAKISQASSFNAISGVSTELMIWMNLDPQEYTAMDTIVRARMTIHAVDNIPNPMYDGVSLNPGTLYNYGIRQNTVEELPSPHTANCRDYSNNKERRTKTTLSQENCLAECFWKSTLEMCGCTHHRLSYLYGRNACSQDFSEQSCLNKSEGVFTDRCYKMCRVPCKKTTYDYVAVDSYPIAEEDWLQLQQYENLTKTFNDFQDFKAKVTCLKVHYGSTESTFYRNVPKYAPIEVFSLLGGYIGLWLGASLYSLVYFLIKILTTVMLPKKRISMERLRVLRKNTDSLHGNSQSRKY